MSILSVAPEAVSVAAADLSGIGSAIDEAKLLAAAPTLGVVAPAADSVSAELAALFGGHAETYQAVSTHGQAFHQQFITTLSAASTAYSQAEAESASGLGRARVAEGLGVLGSRQHLITADTGSRPWQPRRPALWKPGMSDPRLIPPRHSLPSGTRLWHPGLPGFKTHNVFAPRLFAPHNRLTGQMMVGPRGIVQNAGALIQQIIQNQVAYLKLIGTSLVDFVKDELKAILGLPAAFVQSVKDLLHGDISGAMNDMLKGFGHLFVNGMTWDGHTVTFPGDNVAAWYECVFTGALPDLWHLTQIPADMMQNLADMLKPLGFGYLGKIVQHLANPLNELANGWHVYYGNGTTNPRFKMDAPLALLFDFLGAPILSLEAFEDSLQGTLNNLISGHLIRAGVDLLATPANILHAFLFGQGYLELPKVSPVSSIFSGGVHLGGIFAPLNYGEEYFFGGQSGTLHFDYGQVTSGVYGTLTGGLVPALISMLPPKLQAPLWEMGSFIDDLFAQLLSIMPLRPALHL